MTLPLGGKEAARSFEKFLRSLLPREEMSSIERVREYKKIDSASKKIRRRQDKDERDIGSYFKQANISLPMVPTTKKPK